MKTCTKCGETKPTTDFYKNSKKRDGLTLWCKPCNVLAAAKWAAANRDKVNVANAKWRAANPEKIRAGKAKWEAANQEKIKVARAKWQNANPEKRRAACAKWQAANRGKVKANSAKWRVENAEKVKAQGAARHAANPELGRIYAHNRRARKREAGGRLSQGLADRLFKLQRGKCACGCKQPLGDDYHLDHRMPIALGGLNVDSNMQLLRKLCNLQKSAKHPIDFMQERGYLI